MQTTMKRSSTLITILVFVLMSLLATQAVFAGDQVVDDLDPDANACYEGGSMAGLCTTPEMWVLGWIQIRIEHGLIDPHDVYGHGDDVEHDPHHDNDSDNSHDNGSDDGEICEDEEVGSDH